MTQKALALSVIILAYNEESQLPACLDALAAQTRRPDEVIVVNNCSTDNTEAIARSYPFVTVVREPNLGMIPARNTGFAAAHGDVLARLDADAVVDEGWAEHVMSVFEDKSVMALSGLARAKLIDGGTRLSTLWPQLYMQFARGFFGVPVLWGTNMALRRQAWECIAAQACTADDAVHEDQDISLLLASHNLTVHADSEASATTYSEDYVNWDKFSNYANRLRLTKKRHQTIGSYQTIQTLPLYKRTGVLLGAPLGLAWVVYCLSLMVLRSTTMRSQTPDLGDLDA